MIMATKKKKEPGVKKKSNIKQGSTKDSYLFWFFFPSLPVEVDLLPGLSTRKKKKKSNNINSTCIFSSITSQLRMTSPDSPAKDNPH